MAEAAVLLPVRLETRFDDADGFAGTRLRVLVVPDVCWYDRHQPASQAELDLLQEAVAAAGGPLVTGAPSTPAAAAAFDGLAAKVGPGRALWLARTFPNVPLREGGAQGTRIHALPTRLELYATSGDGAEAPAPVSLGTTTKPTKPELTITLKPGVDGGWWPSWSALEDAGLTFTVDLGQPPGPIAPADIASLYVVGLGETEAAGVVRAHLDAGDLALLHAGTPTNTVAGAPAADLGRDPAAWRALGERLTNQDEAFVAQALTGDAEALGPLAGSSDGLADQTTRLLIPVLWPALRGHAVAEVWGAGARLAAGPGAAWPSDFLRPDGPLPLLRLRDQPYGLWPVSDWERWQPDAGQEPAEEGEPDVAAALRLRDAAAERARTGLGTVVGADENRLWELLAQTPTSDAYEARPGVRFSTLRKFLGDPEADAADEWLRRVESVAAADAHLADVLVTIGGPLPLRLQMVVPEVAFAPSGAPMFQPSPDVEVDEARKLVTDDPAQWVVAALAWFGKLFVREGLDRASWERMSSHWVERWPTSLLWRLVVVSGLVALQRAVRATNAAFNPDDVLLNSVLPGIPAGASGPEVSVYQRFRQNLGRLRLLVGEADPKRVAPELDRVLRGLLDTTSDRVDPWLTGVAWRRLQRLAGSRPVGLYGWVDRPDLGEPGPDTEIGVLLAPSDAQARTAVVLRDKSHFDSNDLWHLDLTSASVRDASRLADDVRTGAHPAEALGREVERVVGDRIKVDRLRAAFPVRSEHAGRRTCDGLAVLAAATSEPPDPRLAAAGLDADDIARVAALAGTVDAYADLLVAGAAHHALAGRAEAAAHALDAAAGLVLPPPLDVLATPRSGRSVRTTVLVSLPAEAAPDDASPAAIASPAFAAWLVVATGDPAGPGWTWQVRDGGAESAVTLGDLGLVPADAVVIHPAVLDGLAAASVGPAAVATPPPGPALARRLAETLAARPVAGADLGLAPEDTPAYELPVRNALAARLTALRDRAAALAQRLRDAASDAEREQALHEALRWGVLPGTADAATAADVLEERVGAVPAVVDGSLELAELTRLIRELAAPGTALPVLATTTVAALTGAVGQLDAEPVVTGGRPRLDATWLELVAAVRAPLARLEAHQALATAQSARAFAAATNHPDDPWLEQVEPEGPGNRNVPNLVVVYGPEALPADGDVALGVLDSWAEVIPAERHTTSAAFRFNAPGSRAPQAILLAVTPVPGEDVTVEGALAAVAQARETAHARMARAEDLGNLDVLTAGILPAFEAGGFQYAVPASLKDWP